MSSVSSNLNLAHVLERISRNTVSFPDYLSLLLGCRIQSKPAMTKLYPLADFMVSTPMAKTKRLSQGIPLTTLGIRLPGFPPESFMTWGTRMSAGNSSTDHSTRVTAESGLLLGLSSVTQAFLLAEVHGNYPSHLQGPIFQWSKYPGTSARSSGRNERE